MKTPLLAKNLVLLSALGTAIVFALSTDAPEADGSWKTKQISRFFWAEGAAAADVDRDGHEDILSGPYWYAGPDFTKSHLIYSAEKTFSKTDADGNTEEIAGYEGVLGSKNEYSHNFISLSHDFNADGFPDYLVVGLPGEATFWYKNPGKDGGEKWQKYLALAVTDNESPQLRDVDGDGHPDLLAMSGGTIGYASFDPKNPEKEWVWHAVSPKNTDTYQRYTHGIGLADINKDGRGDILEQAGWWEQPADWDGKTPWKRHDVDFGKGGAQMHGYDVNNDGRTDVITSISAHEWGLAWFEQNEDGTWKRHLLTDTPDEKGSTGVAFSQAHAIELADLDGDGSLDIITGKRFWAHGPNGDPEPSATPVLYSFLLKRDGEKVHYEAKIISDRSGAGTNFTVKDMTGDGKPDIITANKLGVYLHTQ